MTLQPTDGRLLRRIAIVNRGDAALRLIRAVREKRLSLFEHGIAALGGFPISHIRAAIVRPSPDALFLACAAVG